MATKKLATAATKLHHKDVVKFLYWRERAKDLVSELKKDKTKSNATKKFLKVVNKLDKIKLSDMGV